MLTADAIHHFGTKTALARALYITPQALTDWGERVPPLRQLQLEKLTSGVLMADPVILAMFQGNSEAAKP